MVRREAGSPDIRYLIEHEAEAVGQLAARRDGDTAFIYGFSVLSGLRGRGIGRSALAEALRKLGRERGCSRFRLEVAAANDRALGLYGSAGFRTTNTVDYYKKLAE